SFRTVQCRAQASAWEITRDQVSRRLTTEVVRVAGSSSPRPGRHDEVAGAPLRRRPAGRYPRVDVHRVRGGRSPVHPQLRRVARAGARLARPLARAAPLLLEERQVGARPRAPGTRHARFLGAERVPYAGRSVAGREIRWAGPNAARDKSVEKHEQERRLAERRLAERRTPFDLTTFSLTPFASVLAVRRSA